MHALCGQVFLTPEYLGIAMDYATDGDMFQLVVRQRGLLEKDARWYFQQLITAVDYCHRMVGASQTSLCRELCRFQASIVRTCCGCAVLEHAPNDLHPALG